MLHVSLPEGNLSLFVREKGSISCVDWYTYIYLYIYSHKDGAAMGLTEKRGLKRATNMGMDSTMAWPSGR